jgi:hypothetical protein
MQSDQLLHEFRLFRAEVLARLDALDPLHGEALLDQVLQRLTARGLPVLFSVAELQTESVVTPEQARRLTYALRELQRKRGGLIGDLAVTQHQRHRGAWVYLLRRRW